MHVRRGHLTIRNIYAALAGIIFAMHVWILFGPVNSLLASDMCVTCASALATFAVWHRGVGDSAQVRTKWTIFSIGLMFWLTGQVGMTIYDQAQGGPQPYALGFDFALFFFGVPILIALASPREQVESRFPFALNCLQIAVAAFLIYLQIHPEVAGSTAHRAIAPRQMMHAYNTEHLLLTLVAVIRLLARPRGEEKSFFQVTFAFVALYTGLTLGLNYAEYILNVPNGTPLDLLWDLPFLVIAPLSFSIVSTKEGVADSEAEPVAGQFVQFLKASAPMFVTIALLLLGGFVARERFGLGMSCVALATLSYGVNTSLLQARFFASEQSLLISQASLMRANDRLEQLSFLDGLTGVANRRSFDQSFPREWHRTARTGSSLSLMMIDIDHFKRLNDTHGHQHGDLCLSTVAASLKACVRRPGDILARYGGEEFVVLLPDADAEGTQVLAENILQTIAALKIANQDNPLHTTLTVSVGIATCAPATDGSPKELLALADAALYQAKKEGRNRLIHAPQMRATYSLNVPSALRGDESDLASEAVFANAR